MHWACSGGHTKLVAWLVDKGVDPDICDESRWTPLIISSSAGRVFPGNFRENGREPGNLQLNK